MKKFPSKLPRGGAGALAPALASPCGNRFLILVPVIAAASALSWQSGIAIGELLGLQRLPYAHADLPALESLSEQVAATLHEQRVCLDAPSTSLTADADTASHIDTLRDRFAIQAPCVDLAIAQNDFETLQIETATLHRIERKRSLTNGFVADSLNYLSRPRRSRSEFRRP